MPVRRGLAGPVSRYPGLSGLIGWAARRPVAAVGMLRARPLWVAMRVFVGSPRAVRAIMARPIVAIADQATRRPGDHPFAAPALVLGLHALDRTSDARARSERHGPRGSVRTRVRLARIAMAAEDPLLADRLAPRSRATGDPDLDGLRGEIDLALGRYRAAVPALERAAHANPRATGLRRSLERAQAELTLLDPAWRPELPAPPDVPTRSAHSSSRTPGRVVHLLTNSLPHRHAGYSVRAQQVARCQQAVGLDPVMVTRAGFPGTEGIGRADTVDLVDGVTYRRLRPNLEPGLPIDRVAAATATGLLALARDVGPALLQPTSNYVNAQVALAVGEHLDLPVVYEVRGFLEETWRSRMGDAVVDGDRYLLARAVETASMRRSAAVVTLSETMRTDILARGGIDPAAVVVIPNAVDIERFTPGPRDERLAARLGIESDEAVIGYISSFVSYEGIGFLIEAVAILRRRGRRVRLLLVGDGEDRPNLEAQARELGLARDGGVIFTGRVRHDQVERYYRTIDVFVVPRTNDRVSQLVTPLKPYEAMAMERPIVVSAVGALLEIVADGETGRSFPAEDPAALAEVIEALLDDPEARRRLGSAARAWVREHRTWAQNGQRYLDLYRRLGVA